jgi:hypothetical protein
MLCKAFNGDVDDDEDDDDDDDDGGQGQDNRIVDVHRTLQAIHTASTYDHHHHHQIKMIDVKKLENALGDIVLQVFFFGIISDEVDTEV